MHIRSRIRWQTINYLEWSDANSEEDLKNEPNLEAKAYWAWYEKNKRDKTHEHVKQHQFRKIALLEEAMVQDTQVLSSNIMASKSLHTFKYQT